MRNGLCCLMASLILSVSFLAWQSAATNGAEDSRARALVSRALEKIGGAAALHKTGGLALEAEGVWDAAAELQGMKPDAANPVKFVEKLALDLAADRLGYESRHTRYDGTEDSLRFVYLNRNQMRFAHITDRFAFWRQDDGFVDERRRLAHMIPHLLLAEALEHPASLHYLGARSVAGRSYERVSWRFPSGETLTLFFDRDKGWLKGFEQLVDAPLLGDTPVQWEFDEYRRAPGFGLYPAGYRIKLGTRLLKQMRYTQIQSGSVAESELFSVPAGITPPQPPAPAQPATAAAARPQQPRVTQAAPGVYFVANVRSGSHAMFIEFADYLMAFDAPSGYLELHQIPAKDFVRGATSSSASEELIRVMKEIAPNKPIRYVALTHFHSDHAGGARAFIAEGATILTTKAARPLIERAARARFTINPDRLSRNPKEPKFEIVSGRRVISDSAQQVELIEVGKNPHADEMLVMRLPRDGIVFVADLFTPWSLQRRPSAGHIPLMKFFAGWLDDRGIEPVKIYGAHGAGAATPEHLERIRLQAQPNQYRER
ncbi:MAG: MBL fold metallo-hydrolase [Acidobacteria bacterium]|nr:MBL fold metallo-hydrolase [Acidobacteriota bacterium]